MSEDKATPQQKGQNLLGFYRAQKDIPKADYREADIRKAHCPGIELIYHDLTRLNAQQAILNDAQILQCNLHQANFQYSQLNTASLAFSQLEGSRFGACKAPDINFRQSNLRTANFQQTLLWRANFTLSNLELADFSGADLRWADLRGTNLRHCKLRTATLIGAVFNQQTLDASQWTHQEHHFLIDQGAIWQNAPVQQSVYAEGIHICSNTKAPEYISWALQSLAALCQCSITIIGEGNNLFLQSASSKVYALGQEIGHLSNLPEQSILQGNLHEQQIVTLHQWLKAGATINLWKRVKSEIILVETWTHEDALEVKR